MIYGLHRKSKPISMSAAQKTPKLFPKKNNADIRRESIAKRYSVSSVTRRIRYNVNPKISGMDDSNSIQQSGQNG